VIDPVRQAEPGDLLGLVSELLLAAQDPGRWPAALGRLVAWLGCEQAMLLRGDGGKRVVLATNFLSPDAIRGLAGRRGDPDATWPHCPPSHIGASSVHTVPQPPQWNGSVSVSTGVPL